MQKLAVIFTLFLFAGAANAGVITFEGQANPGQQLAVGNNYSEMGFNFFNPGQPTSAAIIGQPAQNTSGSDYYTWNSPAQNNPVSLTNILGEVFSLASLDVGSKNGNVANFSIVGNLFGGGTVAYNVIGASSFSNLSLNWTNLMSVEFAYGSGDFGAIDNLVVNVVDVPEPGTLILLALGLLGLGAKRKTVIA